MTFLICPFQRTSREVALLYAKVPGVSAVYRDEYKVRDWIRKFPANVTR